MNIFVIETPLQLINAIEAKKHYEFKNNMLIVLLRGLFKKNYFEKLLEYSEWEVIKYVNCYYRFRAYDFGSRPPRNLYERSLEILQTLSVGLQKWRINSLLRSIKYADNLILGDYRLGQNDQMRHFANNINCKEVYMVDDGTDTILVNQERQNQKKRHCYSKSALPMSWKSNIRHKLIEFDTVAVDKITFFSCYDIDISGNDRLDKNNYQYLRKIGRRVKVSESVTFLGQCLVDDGYVSFDSYLYYLKGIREYFEGMPFKYVAHPRESEKYLEQLSKKDRLHVERLDVPIEHVMVFGKERSRWLSSFFCSALQNCAVIFGNDILVKAFLLHEEHILKNRESVLAIYDFYRRQSNIQVVDLRSQS